VAANSKRSGRNRNDDIESEDYANEVYQAFMAGYVKRINESTLRVPIGGVRIGSAKYSRLAQINLQTRIITFSKFAIENVPERGRRYLVLHELAHVKEASHNKLFWSLVAEHEPEYKRIGRELEKAFHQNVREQTAGRKQSTLPLIRTVEDLMHLSPADDEDEYESLSHTTLLKPADGLAYPLDSGIVAADIYNCSADEFLFEDYADGLMYGGADVSEELPEEYFDHIRLT
jgi:hypothetical protein